MAGDSAEMMLQGIMIRAFSAGLFSVAGDYVAQLANAVEAGTISVQSANIAAAGIHFVAGAASGAIDAGFSGGNVGLGAITGGVSAGVCEYAAENLPGLISGNIGPAAMGGPSSGNYRQANANVPDLMRMPEDVVNDLKPYAFDDSGNPIDLSNMMLHKGLPRWVSKNAEAFTGSAVDIYWNPDKLLYPSNYFTAIIGHEAIVHTQQYLNILNFRMMYGFEALIHGIGQANKHEAPAYQLQWKIFRGLNMRP